VVACPRRFVARFIDSFYSNAILDANIFNELAGEHGGAVKEILRVLDKERRLHCSFRVQFSRSAKSRDAGNCS
jgi:hypothetical protein